LKLRILSRVATVANSCGRKPAENSDTRTFSREAATAIIALPPLRGSLVRFDPYPWADAHGYALSPLRG
jgi:hypothetical protein